MDVIQERENTFKKEAKVFWEEVQNKLNVSYSELNDFYNENRKYNFGMKDNNMQNHNSNNNYLNSNLNENMQIYNNNNNNKNYLLNSLEI